MRLLNFIPEIDRPMDQFNKLDPLLQAIFFNAATLLYISFKKRFLITSIYRDQPESVHGHYRGIDTDVCQGEPYEGGVLPMEAEIIASHINKVYRYNPNNNLYCAVYGERDPNGNHDTHIHFQKGSLTESKYFKVRG